MMRKNASRMRVVSIYDLSASESMRALRHLRRQNLQARAREAGKHRVVGRRAGMGEAKSEGTGEGEVEVEVEVESDEILSQVYQRVGGRTSFLSKVSRADDMLGESLLLSSSSPSSSSPSSLPRTHYLLTSLPPRSSLSIISSASSRLTGDGRVLRCRVADPG